MALTSEFIRKRDSALAATAQALGKSSSAPPLHKLLWKLGVPVPPPHFMNFSTSALLMGGFWFIGMSIFMPFISKGPFLVTTVALFIGSILFGLIMATVLQWQKKRLNLPGWNSL